MPLAFDLCKDDLMNIARTLLAADSPSGYTARAAEVAMQIAIGLGYEATLTNKGGVVIRVPGREQGKRIGLCAHIDTLGLMCRAVNERGELLFTRVGGPILPTLDGEYCRVYARCGRIYTGTVLSLSPSAHVYDDAHTRVRDEQSMYVRLDERVQSAADVRALGIGVGDYICIDPKTVVTESGYLKSRFIDDKGSAACLLTLLKLLRDAGRFPRYDTQIDLTVFEEVGHGGATIPTDLDELIAVDMGCVGGTLSCTEHQVSICAKDNGGPYSYDLVTRLIELAQSHGVDYAVDVYPHYGSDVGVSWRSGSGARAALIGPGVHASHGMERTHFDGLKNTLRLLALYLDVGED